MPSTKENRLPTAKLRLAKARRSTIGARAVSTRTKKTTAETAETMATVKIVSSSNHS